MPRHSTSPTLLDDVKTITITNLKKWEYLKPDSHRSGVITWSWNGQKTSSISIAVNIISSSPYMELSYTCNGTPYDYKVQLTQRPANIGRGHVWYFICPHTQKLCRTLYMVGNRFLHRLAYTGCLYESQTLSHNNRNLHRLLDKVFGTDKLYEQLYSKHFKSHYAGKPTKRFLTIQEKLKQAEGINYAEVEKLISCI
ncbi:protein kinase family protein [Rufibacter roseolus]|uniref:hypothetical protein n=1 Tax=Rufibacter roseolus TaxID=2817375 RepID=UPI001B311571|nr:hypothetical protein [Rufibacter roseolus]